MSDDNHFHIRKPSLDLGCLWLLGVLIVCYTLVSITDRIVEAFGGTTP